MSARKTVVFVSEEKKALMAAWYDRFRERLVSPTPIESREVKTSFGKTHALLTGPVDGAPLVILHGALASSAHLLPELGSLVNTRRVYAIDVIGQSGRSEDRRVPVDDDSYGRWVAEATTALGLDTFDLFGVSWGGFVAQRTAATIPDRVKHLVLVVPAGWVGNSTWASLRDAGFAMLAYRFFPSKSRLERANATQFTTIDPFWQEYFGEAMLAYDLDMRIPPLVGPKEVASMKMPVLVFAAEHDVSFPGAKLLARVKELLPHAETELFEGAKHSPAFTDEQRERVAQRVAGFLDRPAAS